MYITLTGKELGHAVGAKSLGAVCWLLIYAPSLFSHVMSAAVHNPCNGQL